MSFRGYQGLTVWNRAVDLVELVYHLTNVLANDATPELLGDLRRKALAIPSHLAAGYQTTCTEEYLRHVHAAQVTLASLDTGVTTVVQLNWVNKEDTNELQSLITHMDQLLGCLERYLTTNPSGARAQ